MDATPIGEFLRDLREGELDSSGVFTLAWADAMAKLGRYQCESPGLWLVKLLQAAVALRSDFFHVGHSGADTLVSFQPVVERRLLLDGLASLESSPSAGISHFQIAIQALCSLAGTESHLRIREGAEVVTHSLLEGRLGPQTDASTGRVDGFTVEIVRSCPGGSWLGTFGRQGWLQREEGKSLQELGRFAPLRLKINGWLVNDPAAYRVSGLSLTDVRSRKPYRFAERIVTSEHPTWEQMALADPRELRPEFRQVPWAMLRAAGGDDLYLQEWVTERPSPAPFELKSLRKVYCNSSSRLFGLAPDWVNRLRADTLSQFAILVRGYLAIGIDGVTDGRVYFVKDGVVMKAKALGQGFEGCLAFWSAPSLRTDLSQLEVVEDDDYVRMQEHIQAHFTEAARSLLVTKDCPRSLLRRFRTWSSDQPSLEKKAMTWSMRILGA